MKAHEIKNWFKKMFGLKVRVGTVKVKHPFCQVWISPEPSEKFTDPLVYKSEFPEVLGTKLLKIIYGDNVAGPGTNITFPAGNVQRYSLSFNEQQWEQLKAHFESGLLCMSKLVESV